MQRDGALVATVADHGQHLPPASRLATFDQFAKQRAADAAPTASFGDINRVLDRMPVGGARPIGGRIAIAENTAFTFGDQIGQAGSDHALSPRIQFACCRRFFLEGRQTVEHVMGIDRLHRLHVRLGRVADAQRGARVFFILQHCLAHSRLPVRRPASAHCLVSRYADVGEQAIIQFPQPRQLMQA